ncbi:hypothetical protein ACFLQW_04520 [Candidatus Zixiibacteriota bacterium]
MRIRRIVQYLITIPVMLLCLTCGDVTSINSITCACPSQGDWNDDGIICPLDVSFASNYVHLHLGSPPPSDPDCPAINRGDWDCDGDINPYDFDLIYDYVFLESGVGPCDPCDCDPYPVGCPEFP